MLALDRDVSWSLALESWTDRVGNWALFSDEATALSRARDALARSPTTRIVMCHGDCAHVPGTGWFGSPLERLREHALLVPAGCIAATHHSIACSSAYTTTGARFVELRIPGALFQQAPLHQYIQGDDAPRYARSNIAFDDRRLFGRTHQLERLRELAASEPGGPVVVIGEMGAGKTALAREHVFELLLDRPEIEVWWFSLSSVTTRRELAATLAKRFHLTLEGTPDDWLERTSNMVARRGCPVWLVLDDIVQLDDEAIAWLDRLVSHASAARWLVSVPRSASWRLSNSEQIDLPPLSEEEAIGMYTSLHAGQPEFSLARALHAVDRCAGHPGSLAHSGTAPDAASEHVITPLERCAAAFELLPPLYQQISRVFAIARCDPEASVLGQICARDVDEIELALAELCRLGWLVVTEAPNTLALPPMFRLAIRSTSSDQLQSDVGAWFSNLTERLLQLLDELDAHTKPSTIDALRRYDAEFDDLIAWGLEHNVASTCELVARLRYHFVLHSWSFDYLPMVARAQEHALALEYTELWQELELSRAIAIEYRSSDQDVVASLFDACLAAADRMDSRYTLDVCYFYASLIIDALTHPDQITRALALLERAFDIVDHETSPGKASLCYELRARFKFFEEDFEQSYLDSQMACELATRAGSPTLNGYALFTLHRALMVRGQRAEAMIAAHRAVANMEAAFVVSGLVMCLASVGYAHAMSSEGPASVRSLTRALNLSHRYGFVHGILNCSYLLAAAHLIEHQHDRARELFEDVLERYRAMELHNNIHKTLMMMTLIHAESGELELATRCIRETREYFAERPENGLDYTMTLFEFAPRVYQLGEQGARDDLVELRDRVIALEPPNQNRRGLDLGLMLAFIDRTLAAIARKQTSDELRCARDGAAFVLPREHVAVTLEDRPRARVLLARLFEEAIASPGSRVRLEELVHVLEEVADTPTPMSVHVGINTLRTLGLSESIQMIDGGYRLDPSIPVASLRQGERSP